MKIAWHKKSLNKRLFYLARDILYTFRYIYANLQSFILKCMIMYLFTYLNFSRLVILDNHLHSRRIVYRHEHTSGRILIKNKEYVNNCMAFRKHIYLQYPIARFIYSASGLDINNCSNHFRTHTLTLSHLVLPVSGNGLINNLRTHNVAA